MAHLKPDHGIFGLPPLENLYVSKHVVLETLPIAEITPCSPSFADGMTLFRAKEDWETYDKILSNLDYSVSHPIKVAFLADGFPTDSFNNEYGENFLQKFTDTASSAFGQMAQMAGEKNASDAVRKMSQEFSEIGGKTGGAIGTILSTAGSAGSGAANSFDALKAALNNSPSNSFNFLGKSMNMLDKMLAGQRIDFPQVWSSSSFAPSYTMTIRLYNPVPGNASAISEFIIGPLAALLCLATPLTDDGHTYSWPLLQKVKCKGLFILDPAVITNITVIKGGDNQQIAWNQRLGIVDVRISFASLFNTMVVEKSGASITNRPTVSNYLNVLFEEKSAKGHYSNAKSSAGVMQSSASLIENATSGIKTTINKAVGSTSNSESSSTIPSRSSAEDIQVANNLTSNPNSYPGAG